MASVTTTLYEWQCPPAATPEFRRLGWLDEATEEGMAWLKSQRGYGDFRAALDTISGRDITLTTASYRSKLNTNRLKRNTREVVSVMSKLRPFWGYHSDNKAYQGQAEMMNKVARAWYLESFADTRIRESLEYAAATARGWARPVYRRNMGGRGHGDIILLTYGSPSVLPVQLPASGNFQEAYTVTILDEMPVWMAHAMFPTYQHRLRPTSSRYWYSSDQVRKAAQGNLLQRIFGKSTVRAPGTAALSDLLIPVRYTYVIDLSVNTTGNEIPMGEPGSSWAYTVPYVGEDIPSGVDPATGERLTRKANEDDARLYPYRRLIISSDNAIMYDGPAFDWHGMFPAVSFSMDAWPWEPLGFSLVHDGYEINEALKELYRGNMDKARAQIDMSLAFDTNAVSMAEARAFDPMQPKARVGYDGSALEGQPFQPVVPAEVLKISPESIQFISLLEGALDSQMAIKDVMALAKARMVGSMDELEKIIEASGPIIEGMSRAMEPPMRDLGVMVKYLILQYYTTSRVMQIVGVDGITPEVFDYDPSSLVPSHMPGEDPAQDSAYSKLQRARTFADNLRFFILPNSLHEMQQTIMKLGLVQLRKAGVMIDSQTIAEAWGIPNYGAIEGNTVIERWQREQEMMLEQAARLKEVAQGLNLDQMPMMPGGKKQEGRPASGQAAPKLASKDGGTRSTIKESR